MSYKVTLACRACGSKELMEVINLGTMPLANDFKTIEESHAGFYPLVVKFCSHCRLAMLSISVEPKVQYENYAYVTSPSQAMKDHITQLYHDLCAEQSPGKHSPLGSVFEIGSNDGTLLKEFRTLGAKDVIGMEPAENLSAIANERGIKSIPEFFCQANMTIGNSIAIGTPDVILARHVFCHIDDWKGFIAALELVSKKDTLVAIEVPYAGDTIERCEWDQIYHEHLSFLSIHAVEALLDQTGFHLHKVKRYQIHGGSILLLLRRNDWEGDIDKSIAWFLAYEEEAITAEAWQNMGIRAADNMEHLFCIVEDLHKQGKTIAGMGASAKSTVWINASGIGKFLDFIADETPQKQGKLSPGSGVKILPESTLMEQKPDAVIIFAWNFLETILEKHAAYKKAGGVWIVPVPRVEFR